MDEQPNVLFVFSDQHRAMDIGCAGNDDVQTPNLDQLAEEGTRFTEAYANYPLCGPSRACILTGQYPQSHGVVGNDLQLAQDVPSIAQAFRRAGYRTGYIGKWHLDGVPRDKFTPPGARRHGFDDYWAAYNCSHDYFDAAYYTDSPEPISIDGYEPETQTELAIEFIEQEDDRPFCLFLSYGPPHDPYQLVPEKFRRRYDPEEIELRPNVEPILPHDGHPSPALLHGPPITEWEGDVYDEPRPYPYEYPEEGYADYYAAITAIDEQLGLLNDTLERNDLTDSTAFVYTSDHGDMLWSQGRNQKGAPFEEAISIPFIIRWPRKTPGGEVNETLLSTVDFAPSLLGLTNCAVPGAMEGRDLSSALIGENVDNPPDAVYIMNVNLGWRGVRTHRYTYARVREADYEHLTNGHWILFDNDLDPYQHRNLVYDRSVRSTMLDLHAETNAWIDRIDGKFRSIKEELEKDGQNEQWKEKNKQRKAQKSDPD